MRLKDRVAIVVGAGQSAGEGMGNGRATALTFAREGARVLCVDHNLESDQQTVDMTTDMTGSLFYQYNVYELVPNAANTGLDAHPAYVATSTNTAMTLPNDGRSSREGGTARPVGVKLFGSWAVSSI